MPIQTEVEVLLTIFGTALCLGGWVLFQIGSRLLGLGIGLGFGFFFGVVLSGVLHLSEGATALSMLSCSLLGGFGGVLLIRAVTTFLFALSGFLFGALVGRAGAELYFSSIDAPFVFNTPTILGILLTACAIAALALWLQKHVMIVITSYVGATFLTAGVAFLRANDKIAFFALFVLAMIWQVVLVTQLIEDRKKKPQEG